MKKENRKTIMLVAAMLTILSVSAMAGTTDTLGMSGLWTKIQAVLTDQYLQPIIISGMVVMGVFRAYKEHPVQGIMVGALGLVIGQIDSIATNVAGALI